MHVKMRGTYGKGCDVRLAFGELQELVCDFSNLLSLGFSGQLTRNGPDQKGQKD
jgi:hypothetical protein